MEAFLRWKGTTGQAGELWLRRMRYELSRFPRLVRAGSGRPPPRNARAVRREDLAAIRTRQRWEKATLALHFAALRQFLRWRGNPIAEDRQLWQLPSGEPTHRRWITREQLRELLHRSTGQARLVVALEGLNGLRRIEVLRLRTKDVDLVDGTLCVLGKGRGGGKWRRIPLHPYVHRLLSRELPGHTPEERLFPISRSGADVLLRSAAIAARFPERGVRVSHHDLRRTFGRLAFRAGMSLVQIKNVLGHASVDLTAHYIGLDADEMRAGLDRLGTLLRLAGPPRAREPAPA